MKASSVSSAYVYSEQQFQLHHKTVVINPINPNISTSKKLDLTTKLQSLLNQYRTIELHQMDEFTTNFVINAFNSKPIPRKHYSINLVSLNGTWNSNPLNSLGTIMNRTSLLVSDVSIQGLNASEFVAHFSDISNTINSLNLNLNYERMKDSDKVYYDIHEAKEFFQTDQLQCHESHCKNGTGLGTVSFIFSLGLGMINVLPNLCFVGLYGLANCTACSFLSCLNSVATWHCEHRNDPAAIRFVRNRYSHNTDNLVTYYNAFTAYPNYNITLILSPNASEEMRR